MLPASPPAGGGPPRRGHGPCRPPRVGRIATTSQTSYPVLSGDLSTDVAVVGAGITGLQTAYLLKQSGARVIASRPDAWRWG